MSKKYVIEIKPEYEDSFKGLMILGAKDSNLFVDTLAVEDLEELNSDYINEHFGDLQDTAYQKGFEDGVTKRTDGDACTGCKYTVMGSDTTICSECCNAYHNQWTAKDDKIEVGDEVIYNEHKFVVFTTETEEHYASLFDVNGNHASVSQSQCKKTGRHFDIQKILEEMRHD